MKSVMIKQFRQLLAKYGQWRVVLLLTLFACASSVLLSAALAQYVFELPLLKSMAIGFIIPAFLCPLMSWWLVALGIELHHLEDEMRHLANYDGLTDIMSRRAFFNSAERLHALMRRQSKPFTLAYLDLDNFKQINDRYGHVMGDQVLKSFASVMRYTLRRSDIVGRIGGEEFALILPETELDGAVHLLNQIRIQASESRVDLNQQSTQYTVSVGLAFSADQSMNTLQNLIEQADKALYQAKSNGKNCVVQYVPHTHSQPYNKTSPVQH